MKRQNIFVFFCKTLLNYDVTDRAALNQLGVEGFLLVVDLDVCKGEVAQPVLV